MLAIEYAKDPVYTNAEMTCIHLTVKFSGVAEEVPFSAMANDIEPHGQALFANAKAGMYGEVKPFSSDAME